MRILLGKTGALLSVVLLSVTLLGGCGAAFLAKPPTPEDEVARLKREVTKVRFAMDSTKELIDRSRGQPYLADLYMRLAELHVEEARYHYYIAYEGTKRRERAVTSVQARLLKNQAISVYKRILDEFPKYKDTDKVLFFIAHEYRELGEYPMMLNFLEKVIEEHADSGFRNEALLVVGDYYFDRGELKNSEKYYKRILETPESISHGMARYKLAWVRINEEKMKDAVKLFEDTITGLNTLESSEELAATPGNAKKIDLRREALVDMVFPYTEVFKKPDVSRTMGYFRRLADSRTTYLSALNKLAKRLFVKGEYNLASQIYRELLRLGAEDEDSLEWARRLYDGAAKGQQFVHVSTDVRILANIGAQFYFDWRLPQKEREHLFKEFEAYCRDLSTKTQLEAQRTNDEKLFALSGDAYEHYLTFFSAAPKAQEIRSNMADARIAAKQFLKAGLAYEGVIPKAAEAEQKQAIYSAVVAFNNALKDTTRLSRLDLVQARAGLRRAASEYVGRYPKEANLIAVKFNYAKSFYDEGIFDHASELFAALVEEYPSSQEGSVSAELALDALRVQEKFEEMARLGKRFAANQQLPASIRAELGSIVESAEGRALETATLEAGYAGTEAVDGLLQFADRHKGSDMGEKALINAFATARNSDDLAQVAAIGQRLIQEYPKSKVVPDVLATLGNMSAQAVDFDRAAQYLEAAASQGPANENSMELLRAAAVIKAHLGDTEGARKTYEQVIQRSPSGQARRDAALGLTEILERAGDYRGASRALEVATSEGGKTAALEYRLGYALMQAGRGGDAVRHFRDAAEMGRNSADVLEREGAAGALFYLSQSVLAEYNSIGHDGGVQALQRKLGSLQAVEAEMFAIIDLGNPKWALAALARLGSAYQDGAGFLEKVPIPAGLDGGAAEKFKSTLAARASEFRGKGDEAISACSAKASELVVFSQAAKACLAGQAYAGDPEQRTAPPARGGRPPQGEVAELQKRISKNSKDYEALGKLAKLYIAAGDPYAAKLVLDKAAEGGANSETYNLRGVVAYKLGFPQEAYEEFQSALKEDGSNAKAHLNLAALFKSFGMKKLAEAELVKVQSKSVDRSDPALIPGVGGGP
ncbi:MAG: tetratricopeptide repeat protein [Deltaproteobacteria bacterium]|nr:tetratricopeptide repeat protein [Deltaproteobacteria bacterium]